MVGAIRRTVANQDSRERRDRGAEKPRVPFHEAASDRRELLARAAALALSASPLGALLTACGGGGGETTGAQGGGGEPFKVGFVYLGPPGDAGWTFQHDQGRKYLEKKIPRVRTTAIENVPEANAGPALDQLIAQGNKMIFATSFGYGDAVLQRAKQHPDVIFEHCSGYRRAKNVATYYGVHWHAMYLIGLLAGRMTKSDRLGFVGSFPIPDVIVDANAFTLGARSVNASATTKAVLINSWYDPPDEKQAARSLIDAGADVLSGVEDSPSILEEAAKHEGVYSATWNSLLRRTGEEGDERFLEDARLLGNAPGRNREARAPGRGGAGRRPRRVRGEVLGAQARRPRSVRRPDQGQQGQGPRRRRQEDELRRHPALELVRRGGAGQPAGIGGRPPAR
jgi:basic membrane lipoprotein Med (substrate-binding protein (PBP1-ABC) superfamily)